VTAWKADDILHALLAYDALARIVNSLQPSPSQPPERRIGGILELLECCQRKAAYRCILATRPIQSDLHLFQLLHFLSERRHLGDPHRFQLLHFLSERRHLGPQVVEQVLGTLSELLVGFELAVLTLRDSAMLHIL
tara:strand:- start:167 stop:574 length:408 start_codon:yes stop_codon:yes gene_type:complete